MTEVFTRRVEDDDIDVFFDHQADPVGAAMAGMTSRDKDQYAAHWARIRHNDAGALRTVVVDGVVAGNIVSWDQDGQRLLGYWIGPEFWGRGIATRAVTRFLTDDEPTRPVHAHVAAHNAGSIRVLEKAGFRRDHELEAQEPPPEDGIDEYIFVLPG